MKTLGDVVDSHSANCFKSDFLDSGFQHYISGLRRFGGAAAAAPPFMDQLHLECGSTENLAALNSVAGLTGIGLCLSLIASLSWRDHEDALAANRDEDVFVLRISSNRMAPQGNVGNKLLRGATHYRQF